MKFYTAILILIMSVNGANAYQYNFGRTTMRLTGYGSAGIIEPDFDKPDFVGDWRLRAQVNHALTNQYSFGAVYSIDAIAIDDDRPMRDAFVFVESRGLGRMEVGFADSIARKLGVGLPDVGGLRINDQPLFYKKIHPNGPVIGDTTITTGHDALRVNVASAGGESIQYGLSVAGITDDYDFAVDMGLKIRNSSGKTKTAFSFGASIMNNLDNYHADPYAPNVTADWRTQAYAGMNLQYNSWIWGLSGRVIYDENVTGAASDGFVIGTGVSYDLLNYSVSLSYLFSDTGVWHSDVDNYTDHTVLGSFRYKYSENVDGWISIGMTTETPFVSAGMRISF